MGEKDALMIDLTLAHTTLTLLPEKAIYLPDWQTLLVADLHLGKSETFQHYGIPIANRVNQDTLDRLSQLCQRFRPQRLVILGDLFHSRLALVDEVLEPWAAFLHGTDADVTLLVGNHDRPFAHHLPQIPNQQITETLALGTLFLSHDPQPQANHLNLCGHVHPCLKLTTRLDSLRLPCFYVDRPQNLILLPSFGSFTGGYEVSLKLGTVAYAIAEGTLIPFEGKPSRRLSR
ncbi:MAG: ligase-associated DNA damage response endonuclease PdeM [Synechococcales bacterium]|nr:ligase-associated DNA damage response endonuclease PdeM [Synechococcales bacterium]